MSKQLENELARLNAFKVDTNHYHINKDATIRVLVDKCYLIQVHDSIFDANSILTVNWNRGVVPKCRFYKIDVIKVVQNMINVNGLGYNYNPMQVEDRFNGWLPLEEIDVLSEI